MFVLQMFSSPWLPCSSHCLLQSRVFSILMSSNLSIIFSIGHVFDVVCKKALPFPGFLLCYHLGVLWFCIFLWSLWSIFILTFMWNVMCLHSFFFCMWIFSCPSTIIEKTIIAPWYWLCNGIILCNIWKLTFFYLRIFINIYLIHHFNQRLLSPIFLFFKKHFIYLFLESREGKENERERNINVWLPLMCPLLGTWPATQACADWESNWWPFGSQAGTRSTEPHQPGPIFLFNKDRTL